MKVYIFLFGILLSIVFSCTNPCIDKECINGTCIDGTCNCLPGYTGASCEIQETPQGLTLIQVAIHTYPLTNSFGEPWDDSDGPDLYLEVNSGLTPKPMGTNGVTLFGGVYENCTAPTLIFKPNTPIALKVTDHFVIGLWDLDVFPSQLVGSYSFHPINLTEGFPKLIELTDSAFDISCTLSVIWNL